MGDKDKADGQNGDFKKDTKEERAKKEERRQKSREFYRAGLSKSANNQIAKEQAPKLPIVVSSGGCRSLSATQLGKEKPKSRSTTPQQEGTRTTTPNTRSLTPRFMPKYQYTRDELLQLRSSPAVNEKPKAVLKVEQEAAKAAAEAAKSVKTTEDTGKSTHANKDDKEEYADARLEVIRDSPVGVNKLSWDLWNADVWRERQKDPRDSGHNSPNTVNEGGRRKNMGGSDADMARKRGLPNEEGEHIVLGPQRKSFGHGCSVTSTNRNVNVVPKDDRERERENRDQRDDRRDNRRIGSGRIAIGRDDRSFRGYDNRERGPGFDRQPQNRNNRGENWDNDKRNFHYGGGRDGHGRDHRDEAMPEWFTDAPQSRYETIELRGLYDDNEAPDKKRLKARDSGVTSNKENAASNTLALESGDVGKTRSTQPMPANSGAGGDVPTMVHVSKPPSLPVPGEPTLPPSFDMYQDLFNGTGFPSIFGVLSGDSSPKDLDPGQAPPTGSRFQKWFQPRQGALTPASDGHTSEPSSIGEDFNYLTELMNGSKSPATHTPTPPVTGGMVFSSAAPLHPQSAPFSVNAQRFIPMLHQQQQGYQGVSQLSQMNVDRAEALRASDVEASLKALLNKQPMGKAASSQGASGPSAGGGMGNENQVKTVTELEAGLAANQAAQHAGINMNASENTAAFQNFLSQLQSDGGNTEGYPLARTLQNQHLDKNYIQHRLEQQQQNQNAAAYNASLQQSNMIKNFLMRTAMMGNRSPLATPPRGQSPLLASPRPGSPIMFGSQPPMHIAAPSPIHPGATSPMNLFGQVGLLAGVAGGLRSPVPPRQPTPQELQQHIQSIMQKALLKKHLQDQQEKLIKKQLELTAVVVSNAVTGAGLVPHTEHGHGRGAHGGSKSSVSEDAATEGYKNGGHYTSTPATKTTFDRAFIPTSVIRKVANTSQEAKDKSAISDTDSSAGHQLALSLQSEEEADEKQGNQQQEGINNLDKKFFQPQSAQESASLTGRQSENNGSIEANLSHAFERLNVEKLQPQSSESQAALNQMLRSLQAGANKMPAPGVQWTRLPSGGFVTQHQLHQLQQQQANMMQQLQLQNFLATYQAQQQGPSGQGRAIVKNNAGQMLTAAALNPAQRAALETVAAEQQRQQLLAMQQSMRQPLGNKAMMGGAVGHLNAGLSVGRPMNPAANPFMLQRALQPNNNVPNNQAFQLAALQAAAWQTATAHSMYSPYVQSQGNLPVFSGAVGMQGANMPQSVGMGALNMPQGRPIQAANRHSSSDQPDLAKFFGQDLLKQPVGSMPQGQQVMTVDELERCQQTAST